MWTNACPTLFIPPLYEIYLPDFDRGLAGKRPNLSTPVRTTALEADVHWLHHKSLIYHFKFFSFSPLGVTFGRTYIAP
jgi:hypothetical protein